MIKIIVTENTKHLQLENEDVTVITPEEYIHSNELSNQRNVKVINLCNSYQYQSMGYYISLLSEARGHKVIPVVSTLMDFKLPNLAREDAQDFDKIIQDALEKCPEQDKVEFNIYFGVTLDLPFSRIGLLLFNLYQMPMQRVAFTKRDKWQLQTLRPLNLNDLSPAEKEDLINGLRTFLTRKKIVRKNYQRKKYDLGILINPDDTTPPSDGKALQKFLKAAEKTGFNTEFLTKTDFGKLNHFDALFIRETTRVNHHTFRFSRKAEYEQIPVIDDPNSILKCTNKVYLKELLNAHKIPIPESVIIRKSNYRQHLKSLNYPVVLKLPDGSFSKGVKKVHHAEEMQSVCKDYFQQTELLIVQEFMPTAFDWRIGLIGGRVIYSCKYFMARNHWQIVDWKSNSISRFGNSETLKIEEVPKSLLSIALKSAKLIGNGLYGVDIKEKNGKYYVIEINDNPSIESGIEDRVAKNVLYESIIGHLMQLVLTR